MILQSILFRRKEVTRLSIAADTVIFVNKGILVSTIIRGIETLLEPGAF